MVVFGRFAIHRLQRLTHAGNFAFPLIAVFIGSVERGAWSGDRGVGIRSSATVGADTGEAALVNGAFVVDVTRTIRCISAGASGGQTRFGNQNSQDISTAADTKDTE